MFSGLPLCLYSCWQARTYANSVRRLPRRSTRPSYRRVKRYLCNTQMFARNSQICLNLLCINVMHLTIQQRLIVNGCCCSRSFEMVALDSNPF